MKRLAAGIGKRAVIVVGLGAVLVSISEYWFYEVEAEVDSALILLAYGFLGYLFISVLHVCRAQSFAGLVVASALLGFLIEGVPVPVVYANPPLSIVWTSLAWHALLSVGVGWLLVRIVLADHGVWRAVALNAGFGIFLGAWNAFMWNAHEVKGSQELTFDWQPTDVFATQFLYGYALFLGGHILLDKVYPRDFQVGRLEYVSLWALAVLLSVIVAYGHGLLVLFPVLPVLVIVCLVALRREYQSNARGPQGTLIDGLYADRVSLWRFGFTLLIPSFAILSYAALVSQEAETEMNAIVILTAGPVSVLVFLWSLLRLSQRPRV